MQNTEIDRISKLENLVVTMGDRMKFDNDYKTLIHDRQSFENEKSMYLANHHLKPIATSPTYVIISMIMCVIVIIVSIYIIWQIKSTDEQYSTDVHNPNLTEEQRLERTEINYITLLSAIQAILAIMIFYVYGFLGNKSLAFFGSLGLYIILCTSAFSAVVSLSINCDHQHGRKSSRKIVSFLMSIACLTMIYFILSRCAILFCQR